MLSDFARARPTLRLHVRCGLSLHLREALERGELDVALLKRMAGQSGGNASRREKLLCVTSRKHPIDMSRDPIPIAVSEQGCLYRNQMIHAFEKAGRAWHIAYTSPNLPGIQAAVSVGLGVSVLPEVAILPEHQIIDAAHGCLPSTNTEVGLVGADGASPACREVAGVLARFY